MSFPFNSQPHLYRVSCTVSRESIFFLGSATLFDVSLPFQITHVRLFGIPVDFFCLTDHGWVAVARSLPRGQGKLLHLPPYKMSKKWAFIAGTEYRRRIPDIFVQISAYYEALLRHEVTCCSYCDNFHPTAFCLPSDFSAATVSVLFSLMDRPFYMLTPYDDLVQFVRLCGFLLVSQAFLFHHLATHVVHDYLPCALLPLIWECYHNGFFCLSSYLFFSAYGCHIPWQLFHSAKSYRSLARHFHNYRCALGIQQPFSSR